MGTTVTVKIQLAVDRKDWDLAHIEYFIH